MGHVANPNQIPTLKRHSFLNSEFGPILSDTIDVMRAVAVYFQLPFLSGFQSCTDMFNIFRPGSNLVLCFHSNRKRNVYQS